MPNNQSCYACTDKNLFPELIRETNENKLDKDQAVLVANAIAGKCGFTVQRQHCLHSDSIISEKGDDSSNKEARSSNKC